MAVHIAYIGLSDI